MQNTFRRSIDTISCYFDQVLYAIGEIRWRGYDPSVLDIGLPGSCQGRSPLEGYTKPARPSTSTWSRRQELLVNPNWLHI
jgi:hypothetical protein